MNLKRSWLVILLALLFTVAVCYTIASNQPSNVSVQSISGTPVANWGGGEQLVYGMPWWNFSANGTPTPVPFNADHHTGSLVEISWEHFQIHEGNMFRADQVDADFDTDEVLSICFRTPITATSEIHAFGSAQSSGPIAVSFWESPEVTGGTEITPVNRFRQAVVTSTVKSIAGNANRLTSGASITTTAATQLVNFVGGSSQGIARSGADIQESEEFELNYDTVYCVIVTSAADNGRATLTLRYYELDRSNGWPVK